MEAKELRLHNKVSITEKARKELWELEMDIKPLSTGFITSIDIDECRIILDGMELEIYYEDLEPIQLTDEWLEFLSAERNKNSYIYDRFKLIWKPAYKYWYVMDKLNLNYLTKIEFVHEWQNFVFAMNNEEISK